MAGGKRRIHALGALLALTVLMIAGAITPFYLPYLKEYREIIKSIRARTRGAYFLGDKDMVLQRRWNDCGAASLQMILSAHGIQRDISALYHQLQTTEKGTSLLNLRLVAARAGLGARSWALGAVELSQAPLPAIAFINGNHFVVVQRMLAPGLLEVADPALGRMSWPVKSFRKVWSGEILIFDPTWTPKGGG